MEKEATKTKKKVRKPQTEEEYQVQKQLFVQQGPTINTDSYFCDDAMLQNLDASKKTDRVYILHACEKAYYDRDYSRCLKLVSVAEELFGVEPELVVARDELDKKVRKSSKVERHVLDLLHIKSKCQERLEAR